ncbi:hypothetical protein [Anaerobaca lacustris]|uniref:Uncharacterized protein n=1 Tax=Anaerobaca lacustris TaxID=3044600 RepID=A0AAW6U041_9BACT|nr:hypothetical protein [Sedimentisphaerales bacterium M17dextr]
MTPIRLGLIALPWWTTFGVFLFLDLYLRYPVVGTVLRLLMPLVLLCNLAGIVMGVGRIRRDSRRAVVVGLVLNAVPPAFFAAFFLWLFFGLKM